MTDYFLECCLKLVCEEGDLVVEDLSNNVSDLENEVTNTGEETDKTNYKGNDILGFEVAKDSVNATDDPTEEDEKQNLSNLRKALERSGNRIGCHLFFSLL